MHYVVRSLDTKAGVTIATARWRYLGNCFPGVMTLHNHQHGKSNSLHKTAQKQQFYEDKNIYIHWLDLKFNK